MVIRSIVLLTVFVLYSVPAWAQSFRSESWVEDFAQLKREMSSHYANLEWAVAERGVNLKQLSDETEAKLRDAKTDADAMIAIDAFLRNFGDGHLNVQWTSPRAAVPSEVSANLCERLGYRSRPLRPGVDFSLLPGFSPIESADSRFIPAGRGRLGNGKTFGVVRIGLFSEEVFPELCQAAAAEMKLAPGSACDEKCEDNIRRQTADRYVAALAAQIERLKKVDVLIVDITGNGGGNDIYQPMARMLTGVRLHSPASGFVRHPHWVKQNQDRLADIEAEIPTASGKMKELLMKAAEGVRQDLKEAKAACDLSPLWENKKADCTMVARFSDSPVAYAKPGELSNTALGNIFFSASRYQYKEGIYTGKLVVMIDQRTASSSEAFASMLKDNNAATTIGIPSLGAGCGYTNGGISTTLKNSGAKVRMPDCVRLRADGSNEINGITPDAFVPWRPNDSAYQRAIRAVSVLTGTACEGMASRPVTR